MSELPTCPPGALCNQGAGGTSAAGFSGGAGTTAGVNAAACLPPLQPCPQGCLDLQTNVASCGTCGFACAPGQLCQAGQCTDVCGQGLGFCGGQCVNMASNPNHCGGCDRACPMGQLCVNGACSTTCSQTVCTTAVGAECVSLTDSASHCGMCNRACPQGDICVGGQCVLDCGTLTACNDACVDTQADNFNCGICGMACGVGKTCMAGVCTCTGGLTACGEACIDTSMDPEHCGMCDHACGGGGVCNVGQCAGPDGCTDIPVDGLTLSAVDVYQTVQIPIMEGGTAISTATRNADVVVARRTLFRIHVTPGAGWTPHEVSARVELTDVDMPMSDQSEIFFAQITPTGPSSDADPDSTFNVAVPPEAITANTRYSVTLVECDGAAAPPAVTTGTRFPSSGYEALGARVVGPLRVHIIPMGAVDTSDTWLGVFKDRLEAVYPIPEVIFTVGSPTAGTASTMCSLLASVTAVRSQDNAPSDVYYYGLTPSTVGGQSGCSNTGGSKASAGWAGGFDNNPETGAGTMCHELGHAHGRLHAPCNVQDPDPGYPYPNADTGVYGYDFRKGIFLGPNRKDMMSYCPEPRYDAWVSDYNYQAILNRAAQTNKPEVPQKFGEPLAPKVPWRLLVSDSGGVHWIDEALMVQGTPEGEPMQAIIHGDQGAMQQVEVYRQDLEDGVSQGAFMLTLPEPDATWRAIEVTDLLAPTPF